MPRSEALLVLLHGSVTRDPEPQLPADGSLPYSGAYPKRGRWLSEDYTRLRNAAWAARNNRVARNLNPLALKAVLVEAERLIARGAPLGDVLEAFAELLMTP